MSLTSYWEDEDRNMFGGAYKAPPNGFPHGEWVTIARYEKTGADGSPSEIDVSRWPATFYRLRVLPSVNSCNEPKAGFTLTTGSGRECGRLVVAIAKAAAEGMIGLDAE